MSWWGGGFQSNMVNFSGKSRWFLKHRIGFQKNTPGPSLFIHMSHDKKWREYWLFNRDPYNFIMVYYNPYITG